MTVSPTAPSDSCKIPFHPLVKRKCMESLVKNFPRCKSTSDTFRIINNAVLSLGCNADDTLFASSVCVDEINHHQSSLNRCLADFWGECFYMGGLGGIPFIGNTGFKAYSAHVPKNGNILILFAPQVGVSPDGQIG